MRASLASVRFIMSRNTSYTFLLESACASKRKCLPLLGEGEDARIAKEGQDAVGCCSFVGLFSRDFNLACEIANSQDPLGFPISSAGVRRGGGPVFFYRTEHKYDTPCVLIAL